MIDYAQALALLAAHLAPLPSERVAAADALGRVLASPIASPEDLPPFANSAMDGFALRVGATPFAAGSEFEVGGGSAAGDAPPAADGPAWEIMTGAVVPPGFGAVVPIERVEVLARDGAERPRRIRLLAEVAPGQHLRRQGEDVARGAALVGAGAFLRAEHLALFAAVGVAELEVVRRPRVAIINTGRELVDDPRRALAPGQIRNSNGQMLADRLRLAGARVLRRVTVGDEEDAFAAALESALEAGADLVLSTGAVSMGRHDFIPAALRSAGAEILFHRLRVRPGKPQLFARLAGGQAFFGLPGNPVSGLVGLRFVVEPALRLLFGLPPERPLRVALGNAPGRPVAMRRFLKAQLRCDAAGRLRAFVLDGQESFRMQPLLRTGAWVVLGEDAAELEPGALVDVYGLGHFEAPRIAGDFA